MGRVIIFGAAGRTGRAAVGEAVRRDHRVTAVVRDPAAHPDLTADGVVLTAGDVTVPADVARLAVGHDAAIVAVYDPRAQPEAFFTMAAAAVLDGLRVAAVHRLVMVGLASVLPTAAGPLLMDTADYPQDYRSFYLGHAAGADALRRAATDVDWLLISPAGDFDHGAARAHRYRTAAADAASRISHADFALALLDESDAPRHHRVHVGVEAY